MPNKIDEEINDLCKLIVSMKSLDKKYIFLYMRQIQFIKRTFFYKWKNKLIKKK